ncbi:unnamed protein product [Rotaria magnacalcarata]|uniref:Protein phosphatase 1 regulatory subunit 42 n=1 Tax=Rotaria magnacalcarata TaxID=392030 RepID=A0A815RK09_9BILA|nr:unnamed protein product [Rotaria magnacalcarata]CAF1586266.1 unnamed protein product [Rotaria magnacalcarata]CAF2052961.1 unnamed protein product [Rotaria magnacalcarata]CAF2073358.1 unnamed protein product [Rotaria magnacalcarata]CAF2092840.1 unnamed protein product [Rotaria magnacalcarata]
MVKLTPDLIAKQAPGHNKRRADESVEHYLSRLTHLPFQDRAIDSIDFLPPCRQLTVIYLYDNFITKIENFNFAENLTHLYLQNNRIQKLENLDGCPKLQKLYIGGNQIQVLEGLEKCTQLSEVYAENQRLPEGEKLLFEPRTLQCLSSVLEILNVSGNNLDSLVELSGLEKLQELTANNNNLDNLRELVQLISIWPRLKRLDTSRNPMCSKSRYRERLIVVSTTLEMLDGKQITDNSRQFLMSWKASREAQQIREKSRPDLLDQGFLHMNNGDYRRNVYKADVGLIRKSQFSTGGIPDTTQQITIVRKDKHPNFPDPNNFNGTGMTNSNHHHSMSRHDAAEQAFLK